MEGFCVFPDLGNGYQYVWNTLKDESDADLFLGQMLTITTTIVSHPVALVHVRKTSDATSHAIATIVHYSEKSTAEYERQPEDKGV